ncbi:fimbrial protein [Pigmentiphaga litoralis]|uniref:fimbrial protein n=1 Tax=Pigmentiphaga litoralis TaxID=516702 RepID=UPI001674652C|nr:fimbrial protein [Pigmentiphaga litoralis]
MACIISPSMQTTRRQHFDWQRICFCTEPTLTQTVPIMKKFALVATLFAALPFTASAQSANTINFKGTIVDTGCSVSSSTVSGGVANLPAKTDGIEVNLGTVAATDIGTAGTAFSGGAGVPAGTGANVTLTFDCGNAKSGGTGGGAPTKFTVSFNAKNSDIDNTALGTLKIAGGTGAAAGVAIALFQDEKLINIQSSQAPVTGNIANGKGTMNLRAMYVRNGTGAIVPGIANASLPFTLRYE